MLTQTLPQLADQYAQVCEDLHRAAASFGDGAQALRRHQHALAEERIRAGLDRLDKVIEEIPTQGEPDVEN